MPILYQVYVLFILPLVFRTNMFYFMIVVLHLLRPLQIYMTNDDYQWKLVSDTGFKKKTQFKLFFSSKTYF